MNILTADSGSTKTEWVLTSNETILLRCFSSGINPALQSTEDILHTLQTEIAPSLSAYPIDKIDFYGAGCSGKRCETVRQALAATFGPCAISVESDLLGAARALCRDREGIACILGTGANSCLYDGKEIVRNTPALGFILGDEGSGAVLGRRLVGDVFKRQLPTALCEAFQEKYQLSMETLIEKVYRTPFPNRFLASFTHFLGEHKEHPAIRSLLLEEFSRFFVRNVAAYGRPDLPVHFVGSIAFHFRKEVETAGQTAGFTVGTIKKAPLSET